MSYQATDAVLRYSQAENAARLVLLVIAAHADDRGRDSYPGVPLICRESRLSDRAVRYALKELVESGELVVDQPSAGRVPAVYSVNLPAWEMTTRPTLQNSSLNPANNAGLSLPNGANNAGLDDSTPQIMQGSTNPTLQIMQGSKTQPCKIRHSTLQNFPEHIGRTVHEPEEEELFQVRPERGLAPENPAGLTTVKPLTAGIEPVAEPVTAQHPAVQAVRQVLNRYPNRATFPAIAEALGGVPDTPRLRECFVEWCKRGFNPLNLAWLFQWYACGIPPDTRASPALAHRNGAARFATRNTAQNEAAMDEAIRRMEVRRNAG